MVEGVRARRCEAVGRDRVVGIGRVGRSAGPVRGYLYFVPFLSVRGHLIRGPLSASSCRTAPGSLLADRRRDHDGLRAGMTSSIRAPELRPRAAAANVEGGRLRVSLEDGREVSVPVTWFEWLHRASGEAAGDVDIVEYGLGLWWPTLDEGISVPWLLGLPHH